MTERQLFQMEKLDHTDRERVFYAIVSVLGKPTSFLEIGCGDGWLVRAARQLMCRPSLGIGSAADAAAASKWATVLVRDYSAPFDIRGKYGLVLALGQRVHLETARQLVEPGGYLVTTEFAGTSIGLAYDERASDRLYRILEPTRVGVYQCHEW